MRIVLLGVVGGDQGMEVTGHEWLVDKWSGEEPRIGSVKMQQGSWSRSAEGSSCLGKDCSIRQ